MNKFKVIAGFVVLSGIVTACSDGGSEPRSEGMAQPSPVGPPAASDVTTLDGTTFASFSGNAAAGKAVFAQCRMCHVTYAGVNKTGPTLNGIIGRKAGSVPGFAYSAANTGSGITWTKEKLFQYLEKPYRVLPQSRMIFAGLPDAQKRADLIAYLASPN